MNSKRVGYLRSLIADFTWKGPGGICTKKFFKILLHTLPITLIVGIGFSGEITDSVVEIPGNEVPYKFFGQESNEQRICCKLS